MAWVWGLNLYVPHVKVMHQTTLMGSVGLSGVAVFIPIQERSLSFGPTDSTLKILKSSWEHWKKPSSLSRLPCLFSLCVGMCWKKHSLCQESPQSVGDMGSVCELWLSGWNLAGYLCVKGLNPMCLVCSEPSFKWYSPGCCWPYTEMEKTLDSTCRKCVEKHTF